MNKDKPTLFLIRGVAGAGKSTFANLLNQYALTMINLEADDFFQKYNAETNSFDYNFDPTKLKDAHQWCQSTAMHFLEQGFNVSVSNTSVTDWEVGQYMDIANLAGANFVSLIVENYHGNKNIHGCPDEKVQQMKRKFYVQL
jgi:uridine kinase